jgi:hypothetical protein
LAGRSRFRMRKGKSKYCSRDRTEDRVKMRKKTERNMRDIRRDGAEGNEEQERYEEKDRRKIDIREEDIHIEK